MEDNDDISLGNCNNLHEIKEEKRWCLQSLGKLFIQFNHTVSICTLCKAVILDIIERAKEDVEKAEGSERQKKYLQFCIALSQAGTLCPDTHGFTVEYLKKNRSFLFVDKQIQHDDKFVVQLAKAAWQFVCFLGEQITNIIQLEDVLNFLLQNEGNENVVWFCVNTMAEMLHMTSSQRDRLLQTFISDQESITKLKLRNAESFVQNDTNSQKSSSIGKFTPEKIATLLQSIVDTDLHREVVMVAGIILPKITVTEEILTTSSLVPVPSMMNNLRSLALAISSSSPVLLQGPVGCGKTSLVEHVAAQTGRHKSPHIIKIQLGDQTDSKALLGTYRCTDVPGEFVWQPGILTQAVREGHWILLEDIDYAPMDVVSVLLPLLERNMLSVPGHGDNIQAVPGFRLFATQRLLGSTTGWHRQQSSSSVLLEKMWTKINVEPLSRSELEQVIHTTFPKLSTVTDKLLDIYFMLSAGKHELYTEAVTDDAGTVGKFLSHDGRLISTRDLMNWCSRIATDFDVTSTATANLVLQEALDCFVSCLPNPPRRVLVAEAIGAKLNITKVKAEYYCVKYKPTVEVSTTSLTVGRVRLEKLDQDFTLMKRQRSTFSFTRQSSALLERVAMCVTKNEPILLVGETGTGKTSSVQYLAEQIGHTLKVINMNQQSDSADLLGGFKPLDMRHVVKPFREKFEVLFCETFSRTENIKFLSHLQECFTKRKWKALFTLMEHTIIPAVKRREQGKISADLHKRWINVRRKLQQLKVQVQQSENVLSFSFIEGTLVKALRKGHWVLLDEINLAAAETLECLSGLLESQAGSIVLTERGDIEPIVRHENFRLFACMNPATDVGKKDLPVGIRNRFTELFVDELEDPQDLKILVSDYLRGLSLTVSQVDGVVNFYLKVKRAAEEKLTDGTGHKPHFSLRTLCRALRYASTNPCGQVSRSLYEGFCLSFLTQLDRSSHPTVELLICQCIIGKTNIKSLLKQPLPIPLDGKYLNFEGYWISVGKSKPQVPENYILTSSVRANLRDLARVVSAGQHPVLLQGETSVGKTSLVIWLAQSSGNVCVRVNNHEHTDLQEYVGCYAADETGKLVFKEGVLVEAMRKGHWIILDELNLAPTDVLEALNRLLDDNRELFIPETQETVKAHPKFMLFATQNPPGQYGGRKMLSRAFRNRFIELHFDEIPCGELETILHKRCDLPLSYSKKLVAAMLDLQTRRRGSGVFAGKQGFMTLRDLFRWANRYKCQVSGNYKFYDWDQHMADHGFMLLAGRVRKPEEILIVQEVIRKHLKRSVDADLLFCLTSKTSSTTMHLLKKVMSQSPSGFEHIVWTYGMRRLAVLIGQAIQFNEPILLVGETGCGKTTMCQLYSSLNNNPLHSINCHLHTESADFLGGLRPCRSHEQGETQKERKFFEWTDGPLVEAMKEGSMFLIDEISLADDSVLERLNSVLEPERTLLLAEKGGGDGSQNEVEEVKAKDGFQVFATMNPGGDFGKKELSPALRNRFTEIWCPQSNVRQDLINIIEHNLKSGIHLCNQEDGTSGVGRAIMDFVEWFSNNDIGKRCTVSIRDILSWVTFINTCSKTLTEDAMETDSDNCGYNLLDPAVALIHGACLVFLDGIGAGTTSRGKDAEVEYTRNMSVKYLVQLVSHVTHQSYDLSSIGLLDKNDKSLIDVVRITEESFCIWPFSIPKGVSSSPSSDSRYALQAPTTCVNAQRIVRALQLPRPLLLEGSPGVGKTSLVSAIAKAAGCELVRINLSEQTDVTDLFGADLPVEGAEGGVFAWRDGPLLKALKMGHWVVLDELNLASQSVLEGLNACLDHRAEIYIPELGKSFQVQHEKTRLFACQNPLNQGGGRKGLPRSFLNRFTQVYVEPLTFSDLLFIAKTMYPTIPTELLTNMVRFNMQIYQEAVLDGQFGQKGGPWEFNLRDLFRWCDLLLSNQRETCLNPGEYVSLLYRDRMRTLQDKQKVMELYSQVFQVDSGPYSSSRISCITENWLQVGHSFVKREKSSVTRVTTKSPLYLLHHCLEPLESVMKCVEMNWMSILVGPQSCGKTSLIQVLSHLTGHRLHVLAMNSAMDTTELLGGFEQADTGRHLEEIAADLEDLVVKIEVKLLLQKSTSEVMKLLRMISYYKKMNRQGEKLSSIEELQLLRDKCSGLLQVHKCCKILLSADTDSELSKALSHIESQLVKLDIKLRVAKPGSGGGTFEWVDSLLVQALQSGDWLLIDNVNFCSPSVLDRLNALLEPNGELSINERGVIDGQIPTVKPHPNFRLFLTMDPKFGEISRAMRNRGVEIYIPGEDEGNPYSDHDVKLMLQGIGLTNVYVCDWLMAMHEDMRCNLGMGERSNILDLLHASLVTMQQIDRGIPLADALKHATLDVYVKSVKNITTNQIAVEIWHKNHEKLRAMSDVKVVEQEGNYQGALTSWCRDTTLTNVNQHGAPVQRIYSEIIKGDNWDGDNIQQKLRQLKFAGVLFLNLSAAHDLYIHADWLKHMCEKIDKEIRKNSNRVQRRKQQKQLSELRHMSENTFTGVSGLLPELQEIVKMTSSNADTDLLLECPVDGRWNQQCFEMTLSQLDSQHRTQCEGHLEVFYNRFHLIQSVIRDLCSADTQLSILKSFLEGTDVRLLSHAVFTDLHCLFQQREDLINCLTQLDLSDFHHVTEVLEGFKWWTRLLEVVVDGTRSDDIHRITLYWTWLKNKFLSIISHSVPPSFQSMITQIQRTLGQDNYKAKMFTKFWKSLGHPMPYQCESEAHLTFALHDLWKLIDVKADPGDIIVNTRVRIVCKEGQTINRTLMACYDALIQQTDSSTVERVNIMMETIQRSLAKYGIQRKNIAELMSMETDQSEQTSNHDERTGSQSSQHVELWPLLEYTQSLATLHLVNKMLTSISSPDKAESLRQSMEAITTFSLYYTPVCPRQLSHLVQTSASDNKEKRKELLQQILKDVYQEIWKITTGKSIDKWLNWNERDTSEETIATGNDVTMGPACFHKAVVSYCGFSYMCHQQNRPGKTYGACLTDSQHMQVPLGQFQYHLEKLRHVTSNTWIHAAVMGSQNFRRGRLERQHLFLLFLQFLDAVKVLLDKEASEVVKELKNQLHNGSHSSQIVTTLVDQCCNYLKSLVDHQSEDILIKCMTHLKCLLSQKDMELWDLGACWVYLGLVCMQLLNPCVPVDPVEKVAIKLQHLRQEAEDIECELEVRCTYHHNLTGSDLLALPDCLLHPHITYLLKKRVLLQEQILRLESQQAHRPAKSQFSNLVSDIHNFMGSVGSVNNITGLLNKLLRALDPKVTGSELAEEKMWQKIQTSFVEGLETKYPHYKDITVPFIVCVQQVMHGMRLVATCVDRSREMDVLNSKLTTTEFNKKEDIISKQLIAMSRFPSVCRNYPNSLDLVKSLMSEHSFKIVKVIADTTEEEEGQYVSRELISRLRYSMLIHIRNEGFVRKELTDDFTYTLSMLLHQFVLSWQQQQERKRKKEAENSLYKYKSQVHGDEREHDEIEESEFREQFPTFEKEFQDVIGSQSLDDDSTIEEKATFEMDPEDVDGSLTEDEMVTVCQTHQALFTTLTKTDWLRQSHMTEVKDKDIIDPALSSYTVAASLGKLCFKVLSKELDNEVNGGHLLASHVLQEQITPSSPTSSQSIQLNKYDIYHDPNVAEVVKCPAVLQRLSKRIQELLLEWPDHPTLRQLTQIIDRILSFPITSPVVKFLTGLELLLEKAQDWESNAAKYVSMATELGEISSLILEWRKMELSCWSQCLDVVLQKQTQKASRWWFYLYQLISAQEESEENHSAILKTLKEYMEKSTLGEYEARLNMLMSFHCQLAYMPKSKKNDDLLNLLWNLYQFYKQFTTVVIDNIQKLRTPIERELKGFVKIARWTDMNYWALKQTTEKTHRTLHKHMKAFQSALEQPVQGILSESDQRLNSVNDGDGEVQREQLYSTVQDIVHKQTLIQQGAQQIPVLEGLHLPLQTRLDSLCQRLGKHWKSVTSRSKYGGLASSLDEFTGEVIETVHQLQALEVSQHEDKEKRKSEAKHIGQKKRKALSDLFKYLILIGLSHRKGLLLVSDESENTPLMVAPLDMSVLLLHTLGHKERNHELMCDVWGSCQKYYYKCIARKARFSSALQSPSQELGVGNIERCKGFMEHLSKLATDQYSELATISQLYKLAGSSLEILHQLSMEKKPLPPQSQVKEWLKTIKEILVSAKEGLSQFEVFLHCCPKAGAELKIHPSPFPKEYLSQMALCFHGDELWSDCLGIIKNLYKTSNDLYNQMLTLSKKNIFVWDDLCCMQQTFKQLEGFIGDIATMEKSFSDPSDSSSPSLVSCLTYIREEINTQSQEYDKWINKVKLSWTNSETLSDELKSCLDGSKVVEEFAGKVEEFVASVLLVVQTLTKCYESQDEGDRTSEDDDTDLQDGHLVSLLSNKIKEDYSCLQLIKITESLSSLIQELVLISEWENYPLPVSAICTQIFSRCGPLVQQYVSIVEYYLLHLLVINKTTTKLLSVLLAVFTDLASKGFCTPEEFAEEMAGEGATDFEDIEGGGMGEGEGMKNVSDQIENEDQLDEAQKPGEKKEEDISQQPDIASEENAIEMSDDLEGKLHDLEAADQEEKSDDDNDEGNDEIDKQIGEVDEKDADKLDEQMWGEDDEETNQNEDTTEESGPGAQEESKKELVAKDDNQGKSEEDDKSKKEDKEDQADDNDEEKKPHELEQFDESEYDDDRVDPNRQQKEPQEQPEPMDLPDDLQLDEMENDMEEDATAGQEDSKPADGDTAEEDKGDDKDKDDEVDTVEEENEDDNIKESGDNEDEEKKEKEDDITEERKSDEDENMDDPGFTGQDKADEDERDTETNEKSEDQKAETYGSTVHDSQNAEQSETAEDQAGTTDNNQDESEGTGTSYSENLEGHQGQSSSKVAHGTNKEAQRKPLKRKPGISSSERSLGSVDQKFKKLKTCDEQTTDDSQNDAGPNEMEADLYEHIKDAKSRFDTQTLDVATAEQQAQQPVPNKDMEETDNTKDQDDVEMREEEPDQDLANVPEKLSSKLKKNEKQNLGDKRDGDEDLTADDGVKQEVDGDFVQTMGVARRPESTIHTTVQNLYLDSKDGQFDLETLRSELEEQLSVISHVDNTSPEAEAAAAETWHRYESLTSSLSQELCEQLRLVLEPSQATKLKGDYRTGKRLNMRKVIPYIASQFRKDKIWLRRTKPSKRQYQIMLAIDDSSSMVDNHSKQLAFESLAMISNALTLLESGELAICSFGESVKLLHPFTDQFTNQSGSKLLQHFTFEQKKTKVAQLLKTATAHMLEARSRHHGVVNNSETAQLLLIVSDGRGLFIEGMETVKSAVRQSRQANVFVVFVIIDNPQNKDSILDIKVPVFKAAGQMPEIKSYMDHFPFPFYIILRDINSLPHILSDALRQWFELMTSVDR